MAGVTFSESDTEYLLAHLHQSDVEIGKALNRSSESIRSKRRHLGRTGDQRKADGESPEQARVRRLGIVSDLLEKSGIDPDDIGKVERIRLNEWQGMIKNADDEPEIVDMKAASILLSPKWAEGPAWPVVQPSAPILIPSPSPPSNLRNYNMKTVVALPDAQIGYFRDKNDVLHPTHDEAALSIALQVIRRACPDRVVLFGDVLDFPELGRYRKEPAFARTTQATIDRATRLIADIRANVPAPTEIDWIEGNHEIRLPNYVKDNAIAAFGLRKGMEPDSWPVMSVPTLCCLDDLGATYHAGYPAVTLWLSDRLKIIHGDKASQSSNALAYLNEERASTIFAHTHRREWAERTRESRHGPRTIMAANPGCLCRIDGVVPGIKGGTDVFGQPILSWDDWQQGIAVISYTPGDGEFVYEPVCIHHGRAFWRGGLYVSGCDSEGNLGSSPGIDRCAA